MKKICFLDDQGTFILENPEEVSCLYFPLAGEGGLKSAITPGLGGDCKLDQESFLLEPVSAENLHTSRSTRNFWCVAENGYWSATGASAQQEAARFMPEQEESTLKAGMMWQTAGRISKKHGLQADITSFVPVRENVEVMLVRITNTGREPKTVTGVAAVPIYGRSADNIRDHRNVTSMLHRIRTTEHGVLVKPTMSFDEKGHRENHRIYYVLGAFGDGECPKAFWPTAESFIGEGGTFLHPHTVCEIASGAAKEKAKNGLPEAAGSVPAGVRIDGREAMGGLLFPPVGLAAGQAVEYIVLMGISEDAEETKRVYFSYNTEEKVQKALEETRGYWQKKVNVRYHTGNDDFDRLMRWVSFQPYLRRIYGCSFLPHHDYGRGGRGWRDLWQDCLSLLLMEPGNVRGMILDNFAGTRMDGTNATIIGSRPGEFIADRNGISRVWMDHGVWPFMTTRFYIDQTGDAGILLEKVSYFKDAQAARGTRIDDRWDEDYGMKMRTADGRIYEGTVLEHLLLQNLCAFYEVGAHNIIRLRGADWNDALDMAAENGESVAFTFAYAGNLKQLAACLRLLGDTQVELLAEIGILLAKGEDLYADPERKQELLARYLETCIHTAGERKIKMDIETLAGSLEEKADWLMRFLRSQEWIETAKSEGWFNSYYDNHGRAVEGITDRGVRMMLTGQVFAVMSGTASEEQVEKICRSADHYLYDAPAGGYRLNTDFKELKFDMGRMFGFAYGEKENGAVFSHMTVMYANALYRRGFAREGYRALQTLADAALDFETSKIYPGIPEYFNNDGRGMYHYLTGAGSWYMMTMITQVFGVRGEAGDLILEPKLMKEQFDENGTAKISLTFAGKEFEVIYHNPELLDYGKYVIRTVDGADTGIQAEIICGGYHAAAAEIGRTVPEEEGCAAGSRAILYSRWIQGLSEGPHRISVELAAEA